MNTPETRSPGQDLRDLNERIGQQEKNGDAKAVEFFGKVLADDLIFRRASGIVVTKPQFLDDLKPDAFEVLNWVVQEPEVYDDGAVVAVTVEAKRRGEQRDKPGHYLNVRKFVKRRGLWQLVAWLNTEMKP